MQTQEWASLRRMADWTDIGRTGELPMKVKPVFVMIDGKEYKAFLTRANEWFFCDESQEQLGIKEVKDMHTWSKKISHWKYK